MRNFFLLLLFPAGLLSCHTYYQAKTVQYKDYRINQPASNDNPLSQMLKPYADSVNKSMNDVVAVAAMELEKKQPEGTLGNVLADAMLSKAAEKYHTKVDAAFINFGGIRIPSIPKGNITRGKIFELSPFDNIIVLQHLNGKVFQQFLDHISGRGGWPAAGISWQIKNKKAINVKVNGQPLDESATYTVAYVDYVANGGDDCSMLKVLPQINNGSLFREAVIEYFASLNSQGKQVSSTIQNRVTYAE